VYKFLTALVLGFLVTLGPVSQSLAAAACKHTVAEVQKENAKDGWEWHKLTPEQTKAVLAAIGDPDGQVLGVDTIYTAEAQVQGQLRALLVFAKGKCFVGAMAVDPDLVKVLTGQAI